MPYCTGQTAFDVCRFFTFVVFLFVFLNFVNPQEASPPYIVYRYPFQ